MLMYFEPLDVIPLWGFLVLTLTLCGLAVECGYRVGAWRHLRAAEEKETPVSAMVAAILGLLAFLLAFTFSMAASRFDSALPESCSKRPTRSATTYLRTRLLPDASQPEIRELLREYVDVRIRGVQELKIAEAIARSEELHDLIWAEAVKASKHKDSNSIMTGLFIQALNDMIDVHSKRILVAGRSRVPLSIWVGLFLLTLLSMTAVGYQAGLSATRRSPAMLGMVLAFAGVFFLIADLDRGHEGFLKVSQQSMLDLQKSMQTAQP